MSAIAYQVVLWSCASIAMTTAAPMRAGVVSTAVPRRAVLRSGALAAGCCTLVAVDPASATFTSDVRGAEAALASAALTDDASAALDRLLELAQDYSGMPSTALRTEVMTSIRARRAQLQGGVWDGALEEKYLRIQRSVDPWRVTELNSPAQGATLLFGPVYVGLLAAQQLVPKLFTAAYSGAVLVVFGPLLFQILFG